MELEGFYKFRIYLDTKKWEEINEWLIRKYNAEDFCMRVISVLYEYTTQTCSKCYNIKKGEDKLQRGEKIYHCLVCGVILDKNTNESINMLEKAIDGCFQSNASGDVTSTIQKNLQVMPMNQKHVLQVAMEACML